MRRVSERTGRRWFRFGLPFLALWSMIGTWRDGISGPGRLIMIAIGCTAIVYLARLVASPPDDCLSRARRLFVTALALVAAGTALAVSGSWPAVAQTAIFAGTYVCSFAWPLDPSHAALSSPRDVRSE